MEEENTLDISFTGENVKSTAIVKYSVPKPAQFNKLQCNTDLNLPPSNWLSSSADSYGLQHALSNQKGFSSFRMAHLFPDCVGEVDVVSDAENIKKLLKIPYHKGHISMMVHRIDNTLLIDDFDIYKHLLRTAESEWEWLRKFFFEHINAESYEEDKNRYIKSRTREALKQKSLVSKFLYHSLVQNELSEADPGTVDVDFKYKSPLPVQGPPLPDPTTSSASPDSSNFEHQYNRNVVWTFEDIEMLLGTDMPIFGGGTYPCISLRLHDMNKPINVLTGIDYWLDNLMSNVPEVVMCYHLNGIVQRYELIKTEDLPRLDNSKFSPKLIRDVAQSILSFLKSNATKAGHTYWLFKGKDEEVVKLYDLSSLCSQDDAENVQHNPFTVPVAMLLYRVARNMMHSGDRTRPGTIRILLQNCVKLLQEDKYPEIVTSSHYMLSELYVPAGTNPESPDMVEAMEVDDEETLYDDDLPSECDNVKMLDLEQEASDKFVKNYKPPPPISGSVEERCLQAIQHITSGLNCLKYFPEQKKDVEEENINQANPMEPIPMPYSSLSNNVDVKEKKTGSKKHKEKKNKSNSNSKKEETENALLLKQKNEAQSLPTWQFQNGEVKWKEHLKTLLYEKALLVYATLSEYYFTSKNYGSSLRNLAILVRIQQIMNVLTRHSNVLRENCLLGRTGDCCVMIVQNWSKCEIYREELQSNLDEDFKMMEQLERDEQIYNVRLGECNLKCVFIYDIRTVEQILFKAVECYEEALKISEDDNNMLKRFGNSLNEIANYYLNEAKTCKTSASITEVAKKAETYLIRGLEVLERIKDDANVALLYSNMGHLHRLLAYASTPPDRGELQPLEKLHLNKAIVNYKKALTCLGERKDSPEIWDAVKWELSTTLFNMASIMHENPPSSLSKLEAEKGVIEVLQKALTYCDLDEANPKFPLYQYRAAVIYYRIGSLYHNHIWSNNKDLGNRKHIIQLAKINYEKAAKLNFLSEDALSYFTSQMQRVALSEYLGETATTPKNKIQHLTHCLDIILESREMIMLLVKKEVDIPEEQLQNNNKDEFKTLYSLLDLVRVRLQHNLKNLIKLCSVKPAPVKDSEKFTELYKNAFKITFKLKEGLAYSDLVQNLNLVLKDIRNLLE